MCWIQSTPYFNDVILTNYTIKTLFPNKSHILEEYILGLSHGYELEPMWSLFEIYKREGNFMPTTISMG